MPHYPQLIGGPALVSLKAFHHWCRRRPAKKIKLSDLTTCTEADIASLTKPYLSCIGFVPSKLIEFSGLFIIHFHIWTCGGFPATCFSQNMKASQAQVQHQWLSRIDYRWLWWSTVLGDPFPQSVSPTSWAVTWQCRHKLHISYWHFLGEEPHDFKILCLSPNQYHIRFSYGSGEWRNGADPWLHACCAWAIFSLTTKGWSKSPALWAY